MQQYTCPVCGTCGSNRTSSPDPLCHKCDYKVTMMRSLNGIIIVEKSKDDITTEARKLIAGVMSYEYEKYIMNDLAGDFAYNISRLLKARDKRYEELVSSLDSIERKSLRLNIWLVVKMLYE